MMNDNYYKMKDIDEINVSELLEESNDLKIDNFNYKKVYTKYYIKNEGQEIDLTTTGLPWLPIFLLVYDNDSTLYQMSFEQWGRIKKDRNLIKKVLFDEFKKWKSGKI